MSDRSQKKLSQRVKELAKKSSNKACFDCEKRGPHNEVSLDLLIFVCQTCAGIHRRYGHVVKTITATNFKETDVEKLEAGGNKRAKKKWLFTFPTQGERGDMVEFMKKVYMDKKYHIDNAPPDVQRREKDKAKKEKKEKKRKKRESTKKDLSALAAPKSKPASKKKTKEPEPAPEEPKAPAQDLDLLSGLGDLSFSAPTPVSAPAPAKDDSDGNPFGSSSDEEDEAPSAAPDAFAVPPEAAAFDAFGETSKPNAEFDAFGSNPAGSKPANTNAGTDVFGGSDFAAFDAAPAKAASPVEFDTFGGGQSNDFPAFEQPAATDPFSAPSSTTAPQDPVQMLESALQSLRQQGLNNKNILDTVDQALQNMGISRPDATATPYMPVASANPTPTANPFDHAEAYTDPSAAQNPSANNTFFSSPDQYGPTSANDLFFNGPGQNAGPAQGQGFPSQGYGADAGYYGQHPPSGFDQAYPPQNNQQYAQDAGYYGQPQPGYGTGSFDHYAQPQQQQQQQQPGFGAAQFGNEVQSPHSAASPDPTSPQAEVSPEPQSSPADDMFAFANPLANM